MSKKQVLQRILAPAKEKEKKYDWVKAAALYEQALRVVGKKDFLKKGEIQERIGYCLYRAAFQAEKQGEFRRHMQLAAEAYEKAAELFRRVKEAKRSSAKILHVRAMVAYIGHWRSPDPETKRELLDECWKLEKEALHACICTTKTVEHHKSTVNSKFPLFLKVWHNLAHFARDRC